MFDRELTIYAFLLDYGTNLAADIDDARFADQPSPGVNHPAWLFGHLAIAADYTLGLLGAEKRLRRSWTRDFGPTSAAKTDRSAYPAKATLLEAWTAGHKAVESAVRASTGLDLDRPHGFEIGTMATTLPTVGDMLAHLLTSHEAAHLGHLSNWRRQVGSPYLF